jgi:hypothetical protein
VKTLKNVSAKTGRTQGEVCAVFYENRIRNTISRFRLGQAAIDESHPWWFSFLGEVYVSDAAASLIENELNR